MHSTFINIAFSWQLLFRFTPVIKVYMYVLGPVFSMASLMPTVVILRPDTLSQLVNYTSGSNEQSGTNEAPYWIQPAFLDVSSVIAIVFTLLTTDGGLDREWQGEQMLSLLS